MCGISGIVGRGWDPADLDAMVAIQHHRGPDDRGTYIDDGGMVGLGHDRLSIIDLSSAGHQPMSNPDDTVWIVFNGEVYNYRELRAELGDYPYRSRTDTEVVMAAYERWGQRCVEHFIGMFAFAIWDSRRQLLFCARDRLGIKPFQYAWHEERLLFASEIKAILASGFPAVPDRSTWATYLTHGFYDHGVGTFFDGVKCLPAGHTLSLQAGKTSINRYWDLPAIASGVESLDDTAASRHLMDLLEDSVRLRLRSDVPVGVNLSGGLDSGSLMVIVDGLLENSDDVHAFTASFADPRYDENDFADEVPTRNNWIRHTQCLEESRVWEVTEQALWHQEAPFGGISSLAYHNLESLAKELGVKVLLEGQGVDEILGGYAYFRPWHYLDLLEQGRWADLRREMRMDGSQGRATIDVMRPTASKESPHLYQDGTAYLQPRTVSAEVRELAGEAPEFPQPFSTHLTNALYGDLCYTKLPRVLRMNDRFSMAFSREFREPYLDHRLVEFLFRLPGDQRIRSGHTKFLLRHAMADRLPDPVRLASKRGVVTPQREWLRTVLRPQVEEILNSPSFAERGLFDVREARATYGRFCRGEYDNSFFVWQWVNTELLFRMFIDRSAAPMHPKGSPR